MEHLVYWNCKEKNSALPKQINEFGDTVGLEDICAQLATIYDIVGDMSMDRLKELVEANKDGRCFVLPLKPFDIVSVKHNGRPCHCTVEGVYFTTRRNYVRLRPIIKQQYIGNASIYYKIDIKSLQKFLIKTNKDFKSDIAKGKLK